MAIPKDINFLIIDDHTFIASMVRDHLCQLGFNGKVLATPSASGAIEILKTTSNNDDKVQFIISDYEMPKFSGVDLVKKVRAAKSFRHIPFLLLTAIDDKNKLLEAIEAGVDGTLNKPWDMDDLGKKLEECWTIRNK